MTIDAFELASEEGRRPTWEMAFLFPDQGSWTVDEYLRLDVGRHVEFQQGSVELQATPDEKHQAIVLFLVNALRAFLRTTGGKAIMAPFPILLWEEKYREPDVACMSATNVHRCDRRSWDGADLVVEVLSESNRQVDRETKRSEYARAGIPEYWIVDPVGRTLTINVLSSDSGDEYPEGLVLSDGDTASSKTLDGFAVRVTELLDSE